MPDASALLPDQAPPTDTGGRSGKPPNRPPVAMPADPAPGEPRSVRAAQHSIPPRKDLPMNDFENDSAAAAAISTIPAGALVRSSFPDDSDLGRDLREVAKEAARQWGGHNAPGSAPETFGKGVAQVYLVSLAAINAGFAPGAAPVEEGS